jgi:hypothetical protein
MQGRPISSNPHTLLGVQVQDKENKRIFLHRKSVETSALREDLGRGKNLGFCFDEASKARTPNTIHSPQQEDCTSLQGMKMPVRRTRLRGGCLCGELALGGGGSPGMGEWRAPRCAQKKLSSTARRPWWIDLGKHRVDRRAPHCVKGVSSNLHTHKARPCWRQGVLH